MLWKAQVLLFFFKLFNVSASGVPPRPPIFLYSTKYPEGAMSAPTSRTCWWRLAAEEIDAGIAISSAAAAAATTSQNDRRALASSEAPSPSLGSPPTPKFSPPQETGILLQNPPSSPPPAVLAPFCEEQCSVGGMKTRAPCGEGRVNPGSTTAVWRSHLKRSGSGGWMLSAIFRMTYRYRQRRGGGRVTYQSGGTSTG